MRSAPASCAAVIGAAGALRAGRLVVTPTDTLYGIAADAFDPDRFLTAPDRYAFLPFGAGPRICIGASFALQEAVIILSTLLARFRFARVPGREPQPRMILTLRPEGGVWLTVTPRD